MSELRHAIMRCSIARDWPEDELVLNSSELLSALPALQHEAIGWPWGAHATL